MKILFKDLHLVNPEQKLNEKCDLSITDGKISRIGKIEENSDKFHKVIELDGNYCVPGLFDMHVHFREPGREDEETIESGCRAAASGGFTGVAVMPNTEPAADSAETIRFVLERSRGALTDVFPVGAVTRGRKGEYLAPILELIDAGAVAFSDDGVAVKTAAILRKALEYLKMKDIPLIEHCEDESLAGGAMNEGIVSTQLGLPALPTVAEDLIVMRDILMAEFLDAKIHIAHISSKKSVELVREAKRKGLKITAEVTPHHFTLTEESVKNYDTNFKMNPPLRTAEDVEAVCEGLRDGTIDCIASDHAPHSVEEKEEEFIYAPNGIIGLETELGLTLNELFHKKRLDIEQLVYKLSINPRKILELSVPKFEVGEDANLTVFDPDKIWTVDVKSFYSKSANSPFDKNLLTGKSTLVVNNGQMFFEDSFVRI